MPNLREQIKNLIRVQSLSNNSRTNYLLQRKALMVRFIIVAFEFSGKEVCLSAIHSENNTAHSFDYKD